MCGRLRIPGWREIEKKLTPARLGSHIQVRLAGLGKMFYLWKEGMLIRSEKIHVRVCYLWSAFGALYLPIKLLLHIQVVYLHQPLPNKKFCNVPRKPDNLCDPIPILLPLPALPPIQKPIQIRQWGKTGYLDSFTPWIRL